MQVLRQSLAIAIQRPVTRVRPSLIVQQIRFDGSDPRSSTSSDNHKNSSQGSGLNKSKGGDKKERSSKTDDTEQPGTTRKDWSNPGQVVSNDPTYGKGGGSSDANNPDQGKR